MTAPPSVHSRLGPRARRVGRARPASPRPHRGDRDARRRGTSARRRIAGVVGHQRRQHRPQGSVPWNCAPAGFAPGTVHSSRGSPGRSRRNKRQAQPPPTVLASTLATSGTITGEADRSGGGRAQVAFVAALIVVDQETPKPIQRQHEALGLDRPRPEGGVAIPEVRVRFWIVEVPVSGSIVDWYTSAFSSVPSGQLESADHVEDGVGRDEADARDLVERVDELEVVRKLHGRRGQRHRLREDLALVQEDARPSDGRAIGRQREVRAVRHVTEATASGNLGPCSTAAKPVPSPTGRKRRRPSTTIPRRRQPSNRPRWRPRRRTKR